MRSLYVHCGLPKTETTSIQRYLASIRPELESHGFAYPDIGVSADRSAHHNLSREMLKTSYFVPERGTIKDILDYFDHPARPPNVVLSSEGLTNCLFHARSTLIEFFQDCAARNDALFVIFTFRKFYRVAESRYLASLRTDQASRPIRVKDTSKWLAELAAGLTELRSALAPHRLIACDAEEDSIGAFMAALGMAPLELPSPERHFNARVGLKKAALLYRLKFAQKTNALSPKEYFRARGRIATMPELPGERYDYHLVPFRSANEIQTAAREWMPSFIARHIENALSLERDHYDAVDLRHVDISPEEMGLVRAELPPKLADRLEWLNVR